MPGQVFTGSEEEIDAFMRTFDYNGDEVVVRDEYLRYYAELFDDTLEKNLPKILKQVDEEKTSEETSEEAQEEVQNEAEAEEDGFLEEIPIPVDEFFEKADLNGNGLITADELRQFMSKQYNMNLNDEQLNDMMAENDLDGDGHLNKEEFARMLKGGD